MTERQDLLGSARRRLGTANGHSDRRQRCSRWRGGEDVHNPDGFYDGKTATANDSNLEASNIKCGVSIFGVPGSFLAEPACIAKTGQTISYAAGDDGETQTGCSPDVVPVQGASFGGYNRTSLGSSGTAEPGFADNGDGTVTDNLTGLIWLKQADCIWDNTWTEALSDVDSLANGSCGLTDGSSAGDWRLPNANELRSLFNPALGFPYLPGDHPFTGVVPTYYWSSTTKADLTVTVWAVVLFNGHLDFISKNSTEFAWPVRGGQSASDVSGGDGEKTFNIPDGFYEGKTATANDSDLLAENIKSGVNLFGVDGSLTSGGTYNAAVPQTGQTTSYATGDDGDLEKGVAWPSPRFTDNGDGTVTDNLTGLIWLRAANCFGTRDWATAVTDANGLASGSCGLSDSSSVGDWRLPSVRELQSLIDYSQFNPALPSANPFSGEQPRHYWSSTSYARYLPTAPGAWTIGMATCNSTLRPKPSTSGRCVADNDT